MSLTSASGCAKASDAVETFRGRICALDMVWPRSLDRTLPFAAPSSTKRCAATDSPSHLTVLLPSPQGIVNVEVLSPNLITAFTFRPRALLGLPGLWGLPGAAGMVCCAKDSASAARPCRRGPGAASTASTPGALVFVAGAAAMMREAQRRVVSNWEARWTRGGFRDRVPDRSTGSAPARSGRAVFAVDVSFARLRVSAASEALQDDGDGAVPALRRLFDAEAWRLAADAAPARRIPASMSNLGSILRALPSLCEPVADLLRRAAHAQRCLAAGKKSISRHRTPWPHVTKSTALAALQLQQLQPDRQRS